MITIEAFMVEMTKFLGFPFFVISLGSRVSFSFFLFESGFILKGMKMDRYLKDSRRGVW